MAPTPVKDLLATLPSHAENVDERDDVFSKYAVYTLAPTIDVDTLMNKLHQEPDSKDMAVYITDLVTLREAYDHFLDLRKDTQYNGQFFAAVEPDYEEIGVLGCCLNSAYPEEGVVGLTRCPEVKDVFLLPANLAVGNMEWEEMLYEEE